MDRKKIYRLFDVNVNRAREGLRVLEDTARFLMSKSALYKKLRTLRHAIDEQTRDIYLELVARRDSDADAGRIMPEGARDSLVQVIYANMRRVEESLRVLEEYSKVIHPGAGPSFKAMRFEMYTLEKVFHGWLKRNGKMK